MESVTLTPDAIIYWQWGAFVANATLVNTWIVMALLIGSAHLVTGGTHKKAWQLTAQHALESLVTRVGAQIEELTGQRPARYLPFIGTLFLFISVSSLVSIVPGYRAPTGSLSTTAALATTVLLAVPYFGVGRLGLRRYLRQYIQPSPLMLPFNLIGELSRTLSLAVRLFGNVMSGEMISAILLAIVPLFFPVVMQLLGLLIGQIQAYIFAILATVFIASATQDGQQDRASKASTTTA